MEGEKEAKVQLVTVPALHTYLIKEEDTTATGEMRVSLLAGEAEVLGMDLKRNYPLRFAMPCSLLVFSWEGCELRVEWPADKHSRSQEDWCDITLNNHLSESPMIKYLSLHYELTIARRLAHETLERGPRLAIVGGEAVGSSQVARLMLNYAGRMNMRPIYVDLDLQNSVFLDGSVGAVAFQYRVTTSDDLFEKCEKISYIYGNRKIRTGSFMKLAKQLSQLTNQRLDHEMENMKWKGCSTEVGSFAAGLVLQCPKMSDDRKHLKDMLVELLVMFEISHVVVIDNPDISSFLHRKFQNAPLHRHNISKLEGIETLLKGPKKNKIMRYFGSEPTEFVTAPLQQVFLYEIVEPEHQNARVRLIDLRTELVNKTAISILTAKRLIDEEPEETARRISESPVLFACRMHKIGEEEVTLETPPIDNFWEECRERLWVSMIAERPN